MKIRVTAQLLCALALVCGCSGGDGPSDPPAGASVTGVIREQGSGVPVVGASVSLGGVSTTSGPNGQFELRNVPTGASLNITVTAPGYDALTQSVAVNAGANSVTITLVRNGLFVVSDYLVYLPPEVATYRGVFFVMFGGTVDSRPLLRGDLNYYQSFPLSGDIAGYRQRVLDFARRNGLAVVGSVFGTQQPGAATYARILSALSTVASQSGHAELADAPFIAHGHSASGCLPYDFAATHPERTMGFIVAKAHCGFSGSTPATAAAGVPGYFFFGQNDPQVSADAVSGVRAFVEQNRTAGALWAFAIEPGAGHAQVEDHDALFGWLNAVVALRLAPGSAALRPVDESAGWLGDAATFAIGPFACFGGNKSITSWLPSEQTARDWQRFNSRGAVTAVISC